jgi:hypothetical protein
MAGNRKSTGCAVTELIISALAASYPLHPDSIICADDDSGSPSQAAWGSIGNFVSDDKIARAAALGTISAGSIRADGGRDGAEGLGGFVFGGHGIGWFAGASLPADRDNLAQRRVLSRKISNYFHGPISGLPHNVKVQPPAGDTPETSTQQ